MNTCKFINSCKEKRWRFGVDTLIYKLDGEDLSIVLIVNTIILYAREFPFIKVTPNNYKDLEDSKGQYEKFKENQQGDNPYPVSCCPWCGSNLFSQEEETPIGYSSSYPQTYCYRFCPKVESFYFITHKL